MPPPPVNPVEDNLNRVQSIFDSRQQGGTLEYLVDWEGFCPEVRSWVTQDDILDPSSLSGLVVLSRIAA